MFTDVGRAHVTANGALCLDRELVKPILAHSIIGGHECLLSSSTSYFLFLFCDVLDVRDHMVFGSTGQDWRPGNADPSHFLHLSRSRSSRIQQHLPGQQLHSILYHTSMRSASPMGKTELYYNRRRRITVEFSAGWTGRDVVMRCLPAE